MDALGTTRYTMPLVLASMLLFAITNSMELLPLQDVGGSSTQASVLSADDGSTSAVQIRRFRGARNGRNITLEWSTQNEADLLHYEIQRASSQSRGWQKIDIVPASNGIQSQTYSYLDRNAPAEDVRYLLRVHGKNNELLYSDIIVVPIEGIIRSFAVMPEPLGKLNNYVVSIGTVKKAEIAITLTTASGQTVKRIFGPTGVDAGLHTFNIDCSDHTAGDYIVRLETPDGDFQRGLILGR